MTRLVLTLDTDGFEDSDAVVDLLRSIPRRVAQEAQTPTRAPRPIKLVNSRGQECGTVVALEEHSSPWREDEDGAISHTHEEVLRHFVAGRRYRFGRTYIACKVPAPSLLTGWTLALFTVDGLGAGLPFNMDRTDLFHHFELVD